MEDPLKEMDLFSLSEQVDPYRKYGDMELALTLLQNDKQHGGAGLPPSPADHGPDYICQNCDEAVKGTSGV